MRRARRVGLARGALNPPSQAPLPSIPTAGCTDGKTRTAALTRTECVLARAQVAEPGGLTLRASGTFAPRQAQRAKPATRVATGVW